MKTTIIFLFVSFGLYSCHSQTNNKLENTLYRTDTIIDIATIIDTISAKEWLVKQIDLFFEEKTNMEYMTTPAYNTFKIDAMNVDLELEDSLTEEEFISKYENRYDLSLHPIHIGFLISGNDWGKIEVQECSVKLGSPIENKVVFRTILVDTLLKTKYHRDITLLPTNGGFLIDDVLEYD